MEPFTLHIYIAQENNPNFAGREDINTLAEYIANARGASGHNTEYLYNLATAMRTIAPTVYDDHLFELENAVRQLEISNTKIRMDIDRLRNSDIVVS